MAGRSGGQRASQLTWHLQTRWQQTVIEHAMIEHLKSHIKKRSFTADLDCASKSTFNATCEDELTQSDNTTRQATGDVGGGVLH
eukprot:130714-Hanusia_phi.AAC.1